MNVESLLSKTFIIVSAHYWYFFFFLVKTTFLYAIRKPVDTGISPFTVAVENKQSDLTKFQMRKLLSQSHSLQAVSTALSLSFPIFQYTYKILNQILTLEKLSSKYLAGQ